MQSSTVSSSAHPMRRCPPIFLGFDSRGLLLELVVLRLDDGGEPVVHAMKARRHYHGLLG